MRDLKATLDQSVIAKLREHTPRCGAEEIPMVQGASPELRQYLNFYQLPIPHNCLNLYAGTISIERQQIVTMAWEPENCLGSVIVVHGYTDHTGLYNHLIQHLLSLQLRVICFDLPGHGLSSGKPGFILDYAEYVGVLKRIIDISQTQFGGSLHAIGQSMGGAILLKHLFEQSSQDSYPFKSLNLLAPLLQPKNWGINRWLFMLTRPFRKTLKRVFRPSSFDQEFLDFLRDRDPLQPQVLPIEWVGALDKWVRQCKHSKGSDFGVNIIQGSGDKTLDWAYNLSIFESLLPNMSLHIVDSANHHLANEIEPLRTEIFTALSMDSSA
jgi:alpha-beta hydrolase superfamily lysophospholipase